MRERIKKGAILFFSAFVFAGFCVCSPPGIMRPVLTSDLNVKINPAQLKEDVNVLCKTLEDVHPNLYAAVSQSIIRQERDNIERSLTAPMTRLEFYVLIAPLVSYFMDGHTYIAQPYKEWNQYVNAGGRIFPFAVSFNDTKAFVIRNSSSDSAVVPGSEILSINGIPIKELYARAIQYISVSNKTFRAKSVEMRFAYFLWVLYRWGNDFSIEYISPQDNRRYTARVTGNPVPKPAQSAAAQKPVYYSYYHYPKEKLGIIDFRSFSDLDAFNRFLKDTFTRIQKDSIENVIIDIRSNGGGSSQLGDALLNYITDKPYMQVSRMDIKISKQIKSFYKNFLPWYVRWLPVQYVHPLGWKLWSTPEGGTAVFTSKPQKPGKNPLRFKGNVYVLIGPRTFSSAVMFAAVIKDYKIGTLIGEETGGLASHFGDVYPFILPNTQISAGVSHKYFLRPNGQDDGRGVLPDYEVKTELSDIISRKDTVLEFTKELAKSKQR